VNKDLKPNGKGKGTITSLPREKFQKGWKGGQGGEGDEYKQFCKICAANTHCSAGGGDWINSNCLSRKGS